MSNRPLASVTENIRHSFIREFGDNLFAIISVGSMTTTHYKESWSDIDILVILDHISLLDKMSVSKLKSKLEKKYQKKFGINLITRQEALKPSFPEILLDGKTLQGLLDLSIHQQRLIYCKQANTRFFVPNKKAIKEYSLSNIAMFLKRNRKALISESKMDAKKLKSTAERELRAAFIMMKLAVQYKNGQNRHGHEEILASAKSTFPNYDFSDIEQAGKNIRHWDSLESKKDLNSILRSTDEFIESFTRFIFR